MTTGHARLLFTVAIWTGTLVSASGQPAIPTTLEGVAPFGKAIAVLPVSELIASPSTPHGDTLSTHARTVWAVESSIGPKSLGAGLVSAAWGVSRDSPDEYGANWRGFGKRYALRLSGVTIGNSIEAAAGALWSEDPRYTRAASGSIRRRIAHAGQHTVLARRSDGRLHPAYARGLGIVGNNFITNAWRTDSDRSVADALSRSAVGVTSRFVGNLFDEFWPDIQRKFRRRSK